MFNKALPSQTLHPCIRASSAFVARVKHCIRDLFLSLHHLEAKIERKLQLKMRCRGLKVAGLKGEVEHSLLAKLVKEAQDH